MASSKIFTAEVSADFEVSEDPSLHSVDCPFWRFKVVHRQTLLTKEAVKDHLISLKRGQKRCKTKEGMKAVVAEVDQALQEGGHVSNYLASGVKQYEKSTDLFKSKCCCTTARIPVKTGGAKKPAGRDEKASTSIKPMSFSNVMGPNLSEDDSDD